MTHSITRIFNGLSPGYRALVACAVLLDGIDAGGYLSTDEVLGEVLLDAVNELVSYPFELRMPLVGTLYREALEEMVEADKGEKRYERE
jgi:hypothetical protein